MMKTPRILPILFMTAVMMLPAAFAAAQQGPPSGGQAAPDGAGGPSKERREAIRKKIDAIRIWRLTEALQLDTNTSARLSSFLGSFDEQRGDIMQKQMTAMRELRATLNASKPDEAKLRSLLETLGKNRRAMQDLKEKELTGLKDILTTEQQARFLVFQQDFQREMRSMIDSARRGRGRGPQGGPGGVGTDQSPDF